MQQAFVFISYSRIDDDYVARLSNFLEANGLNAWRDLSTGPAARWVKEIRDRIHNCAALVVVMTPSADESKWIEKELIEAEDRDKPIYPLLLDGRPLFQVNNVQYEDVSGGRMPSAAWLANLKATTDGLRSRGRQASHSDVSTEIQEGWQHHDARRYDDALAAFDRALLLDPSEPSASLGRGWTLHERREFEAALASFDQVIRLRPTRGSAYRGRGWALHELNRQREARTAFEEAIRLDSLDDAAWRGLGWTLERLGDRQSALESLERSASLNPSNRKVQRAIARLQSSRS